jgi:hypothetical protein
MARGPTGRDHQRVGERRAAFEVDDHDVLGLVFVERDAHPIQERTIDGIKARCLFDGSFFGNRFFG